MPNDYILPVEPSDRFDQSNIFSELNFSAVDRKNNGILITPICDISQGKAQYYNFCAVLPFDIVFFEKIAEKPIYVSETQFKENYESISNGKKGDIKGFIKELINGSYNRYHWLGEIPTLEGYWYVDFQLIQCISAEAFDADGYQRIAKLLPPHREAVFTRYSNFMGRVGLAGEAAERELLANQVIEYLKTLPN